MRRTFRIKGKTYNVTVPREVLDATDETSPADEFCEVVKKQVSSAMRERPHTKGEWEKWLKKYGFWLSHVDEEDVRPIIRQRLKRAPV